MAVPVAILATLGFIGWLVYRVIRSRQIRAHNIAFGISVLTGIYTYAFFLSMTLPELVKIVASIFLGIILIFLAAFLQRRRQQPDKT